MSRQDFDDAQEVLAEAGFAIDEARYDTAIMGSWLIDLSSPFARYRLAFDGRDRMFVIQLEVNSGTWDYLSVGAANEPLCAALERLVELVQDHPRTSPD
jgi:hypothetical protein